MRVLLVDLETSGLSWDEGHRVVEVAAALYDTKYASVIEQFSALIKHHENGAEHINGIPVGLLMEHGDEPAPVWDRMLRLSSEAECHVAHRAEFDRGFTEKSLGELAGNSLLENWDPKKPWVCSKSDIEWPNKLRGDHLVQVALGLGLGVSAAHRALVDVDTMARCFTRLAQMGIELEPLFRRAMRPKTRVVALVSYDQRQIAKDAGFFWDDKRREWYRAMPEEDVAALPFRAVVRL